MWESSPYQSFYTHKGKVEPGNNGVLIYPGGQLEQIKIANIKGPVGSISLKGVRRGSQDYEYILLASKIDKDKVFKLVSALPDIGDKEFFSDYENWENLREELARMIMEKK